jgi:hypothetical protein
MKSAGDLIPLYLATSFRCIQQLGAAKPAWVPARTRLRSTESERKMTELRD